MGRVRHGDVEGAPIRRQADPVRKGQVTDQKRNRPVRIQPIDAIVPLFLQRRLVHPRQTIRRVGEEDRPPGPLHQIVRRAEPPPPELRGQQGLGLGRQVQSGDGAVAVVRHQDRALRPQDQAVRPGLAKGVGRRSVIAGGLHEHRQAVRLRPAVDPVVRHVAEQQIAAFSDPDRPLRPGEALGQHLDHGIRRHDTVHGRRQPLDPAQGPKAGIGHRPHGSPGTGCGGGSQATGQGETA